MDLLRKRVPVILFITVLLLMIPLIGMQFTSGINWSVLDFLIAGFLLFGTGMLIELILGKTKNAITRLALILIVIILFLLIWAELAVGLLGSPLAGN